MYVPNYSTSNVTNKNNYICASNTDDSIKLIFMTIFVKRLLICLIILFSFCCSTWAQKGKFEIFMNVDSRSIPYSCVIKEGVYFVEPESSLWRAYNYGEEYTNLFNQTDKNKLLLSLYFVNNSAETVELSDLVFEIYKYEKDNTPYILPKPNTNSLTLINVGQTDWKKLNLDIELFSKNVLPQKDKKEFSSKEREILEILESFSDFRHSVKVNKHISNFSERITINLSDDIINLIDECIPEKLSYEQLGSLRSSLIITHDDFYILDSLKYYSNINQLCDPNKIASDRKHLLLLLDDCFENFKVYYKASLIFDDGEYAIASSGYIPLYLDDPGAASARSRGFGMVDLFLDEDLNNLPHKIKLPCDTGILPGESKWLNLNIHYEANAVYEFRVQACNIHDKVVSESKVNLHTFKEQF